jgi:uncharacterized protein with FMN-binding domain
VAKKISNTLAGLSSAAILAIYAAGYERTLPAADRFASQTTLRRPPVANEAVVTLPAAVAAVNAAPAPAPAPVTTPAKPAVPITTPAKEPAAEPVPEPVAEAAEPAADAPQIQSTPVYKDGVYLGWGYSRHGNIQAFIRIEGGRIVHAGVQRCETRWPCDLVAHLPGQVITRQSAEVDYVTGATQSGDAFYGAVAAALAQAK